MSHIANTPVSTSAFPNMRNVAHPDNEQRRHDYETSIKIARVFFAPNTCSPSFII